MYYVDVMKGERTWAKFLLFQEDGTGDLRALDITFNAYLIDREFSSIHDFEVWARAVYKVSSRELRTTPVNFGEVVSDYIKRIKEMKI